MAIVTHMQDSVKNYLSNETNFAMLITGKWGAGKTYFYENSIIPLAKATQLNGSPLYYLPLRISLYGINSIDELESEVIASIYPLLKNSTLTAGAIIAKSVVKGILKNKVGVDLDDFLPAVVKFDKKDIVAKEHLLLCFDDLERRGKGLEVRQVIGYINSLVENGGSKVIILANEDQIGGDEFTLFKEKTIGISIVFEHDINQIYDVIIKRFSQKSDVYYQYLVKNKIFILKLLSHLEANLRVMIDALGRLEVIFNAIDNTTLEKKDEAIENVVRFTIGLNIEFKLGQLTREAIVELGNVGKGFGRIDWGSVFNRNQDQDKEEPPKSFADVFREKYFVSADDFHYYDSVLPFIVKYASINKGYLLAEMELFYPNSKSDSDEVAVFRMLSNRDFGDLGPIEYKCLTSKLIKYAEGGRYGLMDTISVFYYATRLDNPLKYNIGLLTNKLKKGLKNCTVVQPYNSMLALQTEIGRDHPYYEEMKQIVNVALAINNKKLLDKNTSYSKGVAKIFDVSISEFLEYISSEKGYNGSLFQSLKPGNFVSSLRKRFSVNQLVIFTEFVKNGHYSSNKVEYEIDALFLEKVKLLIENLDSRNLNFQQKFYFPKLVEAIAIKMKRGISYEMEENF